VLLALAFVLAAQTLALDHLIGHTATGHNTNCAICISASQAGNAIPAGSPHVNPPDLADTPELAPQVRQIFRSPPAPYRSRAPPPVV
jgi:hypothetical protein